MSEKRFKPYSVSTADGDGFVIGIQKEDGTVMSITDASEMLNEQQDTISALKEENEQLKQTIQKIADLDGLTVEELFESVKGVSEEDIIQYLRIFYD